MKNTHIFFFACLCYVLLGCAAKNNDLLNRNVSKAHNLREYCQTAGVATVEITLADSLLKAALASREAQKFEDAEWQSDLASTYYNIGILKNELSVSQTNVKKIETELASDKEKLNGLLEVYEEIKSLRKQ